MMIRAHETHGEGERPLGRRPASGAYGQLSEGVKRERERLEHQSLLLQTETIRQVRAAVGSDSREIADICGGPGGALRALAEHDFEQVVNIDIDEGALGRSKTVGESLGVEVAVHRADLKNPLSVAKLPSLRLNAAISGFASIHVGLDAVLSAASRVLSPGGVLGLTDIAYGELVASQCPELVALCARIQTLVSDSCGDLLFWRSAASRNGFEFVMDLHLTRLYRGREVLRVFDFVDTMNDSPTARDLKELLRALEAFDGISKASLVAKVYRFVVRKRQPEESEFS